MSRVQRGGRCRSVGGRRGVGRRRPPVIPRRAPLLHVRRPQRRRRPCRSGSVILQARPVGSNRATTRGDRRQPVVTRRRRHLPVVRLLRRAAPAPPSIGRAPHDRATAHVGWTPDLVVVGHWPVESGTPGWTGKGAARLIPKSAQIPSGRKPTSNGVTVAVCRIARMVIRSHRCAKRRFVDRAALELADPLAVDVRLRGQPQCCRISSFSCSFAPAP